MLVQVGLGAVSVQFACSSSGASKSGSSLFSALHSSQGQALREETQGKSVPQDSARDGC